MCIIIKTSKFSEKNYDRFFGAYQNLLVSENYVVRRQSLKLLGELLLDRHNFNTMTRYIANPDNLKLMMNMLRERSRNIQFEAFHVFKVCFFVDNLHILIFNFSKVFVANPNKPRPIADILLRNREKLVDFLASFHTDRTEDDQFNDEKAYLSELKRFSPINKPFLSSIFSQTNPRYAIATGWLHTRAKTFTSATRARSFDI